jgi:hypothetical protein
MGYDVPRRRMKMRQFSTYTRPANELSPESSFSETAEKNSNILRMLKTATTARL